MRLSFLTVVLVLCCASPASADDYIFRNLKWGMTIEEVKKSEDGQLDSGFIKESQSKVSSGAESISLYFSINMLRTKVIASYQFPLPGKTLSRIALIISPPCLAQKTTTGCFESVNYMLEGKYGPPVGSPNSAAQPPLAKDTPTVMWMLEDKTILSQIQPGKAFGVDNSVVFITYIPAEDFKKQLEQKLKDYNNL